MRLLLLCLALAAVPATALAQAPGTEIEAGYGRETLSGGRADWTEKTLLGTRFLGERNNVTGAVRETSRFGLRDTEVSAAYYQPLGKAVTWSVDGSHSPEHRVLAKNTLGGQIAWASGDGWVWSGGLRRSEYTATNARLITLGAERYWSNYRAGYTLYSGKPDGAGSAAAHRLSLSYYYGERNSVGIGVAKGREVENVGPPTGVTTTPVRTLTIGGRHWLDAHWALAYDLSAHEQGDLYRRRGFRLGLRYRF